MTNEKTTAQLNAENADRLWTVLEAYRGDPLTKWELIELAEFNNQHAQGMEVIFSVAVKRCRKRAEKEGLFIPMAAPDTGYRYVLTSDPNLAIGGFYHSSRVSKGFKDLHAKHRDFIERNRANLPPMQRRLFDEVRDVAARVIQVEQDQLDRNEKLMKDLAGLAREEALEKEREM